MKNRAIAFALLFALACGAMAAAYPCAAAGPQRLEHRSCHHQAPAGPPDRNGCCDPKKGGAAPCLKRCQAVAVLAPAPAFPPPAPAAVPASSPAVRAVELIDFPIDHVPLASLAPLA